MMDALGIYRLLINAYGQPRWWSDDPYTVMIQAVLVQNTAWRNVEKTTEIIQDRLRPQIIRELPEEELEKLIRPTGFPKAKARTIRALTEWYGDYGYDTVNAAGKDLRCLRAELLSIKGIGAETADAILVYAFFRPSFIIDAYTRRFIRRLGIVLTDDAAIREFFERNLPEDPHIYGYFHWLILDHSITACRKTPRCQECRLLRYCHEGGIITACSAIQER